MPAVDPADVAARLLALAEQLDAIDPSRAKLYREKADLHSRAAERATMKDNRRP